MRHISDVVSGLAGDGGGGALVPQPVPERRVARLQRDGGEVRLPALVPALPSLPHPLARRVQLDAEAAPPAPMSEAVNERGERVVIEPAPRLPPTPVPPDMRREAAEPAARLRRMLVV
jgi:hypothetical protein